MPNQNQIIIGLDLDGVILDFTEVKIKAAQALGFTLRPHETPSEVIRNIMSENTMAQIKHAIYANIEQASMTPLMEGSFDGLNFLKENEIPFFLISRRKTYPVAIETLKHHKIWPQFINEKNAHFVERSHDKDLKAQLFGVNYFLDDEIHVLDKLVSVPNRYLFDKHNVFIASSPYPRVNSWKEFLKIL